MYEYRGKYKIQFLGMGNWTVYCGEENIATVASLSAACAAARNAWKDETGWARYMEKEYSSLADFNTRA